MNDSPERYELDDLLQGWSQRRQTPGDQQALEQQIVEAWQHERDGSALPTSLPQATRPGHSLQHSFIWFALGAAAAALVAVTIYPRLNQQTVVMVPTGPPADAWIAAGQQSDKLQLLQEMERLFEDRLAWIAETPDGVQMEIRDAGVNNRRSSAKLAIRVVVTRRAAGQSQWTAVWKADLVASEEQSVRYSPAAGQGNDGAEFSLWAYRVDDDTIAVDSDLSLGRLAHHSTFNGAQISGIPTSVASFQRDGDEFQVYQTVAILNREA